MPILITGATGFIGYHVARMLREQQCDVRALVRPASEVCELKKLGVDLIEGDLRDRGSVRRTMAGCDQVYHLAADYRLWVPNPDELYRINVLGTRNILMAARESGVKKIVCTSSVGALATTRDGLAVTEDTPVRLEEMIGHYKRSKFLAQEEALKFAARGLPVVIVNPPTPVGSMDRKPTPTGKIIVDFLNRKMPAFLDTGLNFVDVTDVARGHLLAAKHGRHGEKYILGNVNLSLKDFFELLADITHLPAPRFRLPYFPVLVGGWFCEQVARVTGKPPLIPLAGVRMARKYMYFDCSKAVRELHYTMQPVRGALETAVDWFHENGYIVFDRKPRFFGQKSEIRNPKQ